MCGIVGVVSFSDPVQIERLVGARDLLAARGPDDSGVWCEDTVGLGHRRLAIIDLSPAGHQPMLFAEGRYVIVYNGEIYNFRKLRAELPTPSGGWQSNSDTEVILAAYAKWGSRCVERFHGMFAFAIWDRRERVLFAARDRMGVKPFYYCLDEDAFAFASRPRALNALNPDDRFEPDEQALRWYLEAGYIPAPASIHHAVRKLPPGHHLTLKAGRLNIERYWDYCNIEPDASLLKRSESDLTDELESLLTEMVGDRLVSDVPLGAFLSGGIDSSIVVALMGKLTSSPVKTFTIGFNDAKFDESPYARSVAEHLGTDHVCEILTTDDLIKLLPLHTQEYDEPLFDSSAFPVLAVSRLAAAHLPVVLTGDGADELFGGYHYYDIARHLANFGKLPSGVRSLIAGVAGLVPQHRAQLLTGVMRQTSGASAYAYARGIAKDYASVLSPDVVARTVGMDRLISDVWERCPPSIDPAAAAMRADVALTLPDDYLQKVDVGSMAFSLEARGPFLDHRLVEWAMRLPTEWKLRGGIRKYLLRKVAYRLVPSAIMDRPKMGFSVPVANWLRGPLRSWAEEHIEASELFENGLLDQKAVRSLFHLHLSGTRDVHPLLWAILMYLQFLGSVKDLPTKFVPPRAIEAGPAGLRL
jgi:asparagine synthase (glutamine-hydrolysing)